MSNQFAQGLKHSGGFMMMKLPPKLKKFMKKYPLVTKNIAKMTQNGGYQQGSGTMSRILGAFGLIGTTSATTAYLLHKYLLANPSIAIKIAMKGSEQALLGSGLHHSGGSYQTGYGRIGSELIKLTKHTKGTSAAGSLGLSILHSFV